MNKSQVLEEISRLELLLDSIEDNEAAKDAHCDESNEPYDEKLVFDLDLEGSTFEPEQFSELTKKIKEKSDAYLEDKNLNDQIKQILFELDQQFEKLPNKAVLGLFSAGILFGRIVR